MTDPGRLDPELLLAQTGWLRRLARSLVADAATADDVVQDTMVQALQHPPRASEPGRLRRWLGRVARNAAHLRHRSEVRRRARELAAHAAADDRSEPLVAQQRLLAAVMALPARDRQVVVMRWFDGLPPRQIAQRLGTTSEAVRSRLSRALAALRAGLAPEADRRLLFAALSPLLAGGRAATGTFLSLGMLLMNTTTKLVAVLALALGAAGWIWWQAAPPPSAPPAPGPGAPPVAAASAEEPPQVPGADRVPAPAADAPTPAASPPQPVPTAAAAPARLLVHGRCVDEAGQPLAGARLTAIHVEGRPQASSGADGHVRLQLDWPAKLTSGNPSWLFVEASGDGRIRLQRQVRVEERGVQPIALGDLVLPPGGAVAGEVRRADGSPAAGARVWIAAAATPGSGAVEEQRRAYGRELRGMGMGLWTAADANGRYAFDGVPVAPVSVVARQPDTLCSYTAPLQVVAGGRVEAPPLQLEPVPDGNRIAGHVRADDGAPLPGCTVRAFAAGDSRNRDPVAESHPSAADGSFALVVAAGERYRLEAQTRDRPPRRSAAQEAAAGARGVVLAFPGARPCELVVTGADGERIVDCDVFGSDADGHPLPLARERAADGSQRLLLPDQPFFLRVFAKGHRPQRVGPLDPRTTTRIDVRLLRASSLTGRVVADGRPVAGAEVHLHEVDQRTPRHRFAPGLFTRLQAAGGRPTVADAEGRFALPIVRAGRFVLHAEAAGFARAESAELQLTPDATPASLELHLLRPATLAVQVVVGAGETREGQPIAATRGDGHVEVAVTDAEGRVRFPGLAPGGWQVRGCRSEDLEWLRSARTWPEPGDEPLPVDVQLAAGQVADFVLDLRARTAAEIRGRIELGGTPLAGFDVRVWSRDEWLQATTDADGRFRLRCAGSASGIVLAGALRSGGRLQLRRQLALGDGGQELDVRLPAGGVELLGLAPSAAPAEGQPTHGYALVWQAAGGMQCSYLFDPGADGAHRAAALPVGRAVLRRRGAGQRDLADWEQVGEVEIVAGATRQLVPR